ncbi:MAG TPA: hypothetical protein VFB14_19810 [Bryobacteraceae bacterium]|jgi:hypothetical protein|nr:hypothetical protein [Bryobacteraceae bacterium]
MSCLLVIVLVGLIVQEDENQSKDKDPAAGNAVQLVKQGRQMNF